MSVPQPVPSSPCPVQVQHNEWHHWKFIPVCLKMWTRGGNHMALSNLLSHQCFDLSQLAQVPDKAWARQRSEHAPATIPKRLLWRRMGKRIGGTLMPPLLCHFTLGRRAIPEPGPRAHSPHPKRTTGCAQDQLFDKRELFDKPWPALELLEKKLEEALTLAPHEKFC